MATTGQLCDARLHENHLPVILTCCSDQAVLWFPKCADSSLAYKKMATVSFIASSQLPLCLLTSFPVLFTFCHLKTRMHLHPGLSVRQTEGCSGAVPAFCQVLCVFDQPWDQHVACPKEKSPLLQNMVLKTELAKEPHETVPTSHS